MNNETPKTEYRFSVFTSTYNRSSSLKEVYECLLAQTFKDFEWVIVDDGSTDLTEAMCRRFLKEGRIPIQYLQAANGGKHSSWRLATRVFRGRYVITADDDDAIPSNAFEVFHKHWLALEQQPNYDEFWEVKACVVRNDGKIFTPPLPSDPYDSDYIDIFYKKRLHGAEMHGCRKVEVLRSEAAVPGSFIYDEYASNFPEFIRWVRAARKYKTRFVRDVVRVYKMGNNASLSALNVGIYRTVRRTYNSAIGEIFKLNEQRDLLLKYDRKLYLYTVFVLAYHEVCLRQDFRKHLENEADRRWIAFFHPFAKTLYQIRERL